MPLKEAYCRQRAAKFLADAGREADAARRESLLTTAAYWHAMALRIEAGCSVPSSRSLDIGPRTVPTSCRRERDDIVEDDPPFAKPRQDAVRHQS